jgi:glycolate oxidase FAD binding subunit
VTLAPRSLDDVRLSLGLPVVLDDLGRIIIFPQTTEQIALVTKYANDRKLVIELRGAGTKLSWGNSVHSDLVIDTTGLTGVNSHSWQDLTATVAAGTPWSTMQQSLSIHNQQVALDPLWPGRATVGGIIATNDSGALRLKYGSLRDLIIGMTIVLADGTIAKSGGRVVKNVAGYDLHKLMTGAFGTLGVIADVTFRLHPIPSHTQTWTITSSAAEELGRLLLSILNSQLSTQAMQLRSHADGYALDVQLATLPEALSIQFVALKDLSIQAGIETGWRETLANIFATREQLLDEPGGTVIKATMLPSAISQLATEVVERGGVAVTQATGIMWARFRDDAKVTLPELSASVKASGNGSITMLRRSNPATRPWSVEQASPLAETIKAQFDPNRILNPGRFLDGI